VQGLSPETLYLRVQYHVNQPALGELERLLDTDYVDRLAIAGLVRDGDVERIVGVSRFARIDDTTRGECAVVVADAWQGRGLGTELMRCLCQAALDRGLTRLEGETLAENQRTVAWARRLGFNVRSKPNSGGLMQVTIELDQL
jgi:acetyltransferase